MHRYSIAIKAKTLFPRSAGVPGRVHEHRAGAERGVCQRAAQEQIWRRLHQGQQRALHFHSEEKARLTSHPILQLFYAYFSTAFESLYLLRRQHIKKLGDKSQKCNCTYEMVVS